MNISLGSKATKAKKKKLGFGLNSRAASAAAPSQNIFGDDEDDDEDDIGKDMATPGDARQRINKQIAKEQAALRQRAQAAMAAGTSGDGGIFDYDGAYDSFRPAAVEAKETDPKEERKSRYIGDLLETAKKRQRVREAVLERKVAKEQALEDAQEDFVGKEKFITKAYRRKLEERKQWEVEEEERQREEEANDVTKRKSAGAAMASFYGNFANNVAMGGGGDQEGTKDENTTSDKHKKALDRDSDDDFLPSKGGGLGFLSGFERSEEQPQPAEEADDGDKRDQIETKKATENDDRPAETQSTARERREQKVAAARLRYLERKGMTSRQ